MGFFRKGTMREGGIVGYKLLFEFLRFKFIHFQSNSSNQLFLDLTNFFSSSIPVAAFFSIFFFNSSTMWFILNYLFNSNIKLTCIFFIFLLIINSTSLFILFHISCSSGHFQNEMFRKFVSLWHTEQVWTKTQRLKKLVSLFRPKKVKKFSSF